MSNDISFPVCWSDFPDPQPAAAEGAAAVIEVHKAEWRKVVQKHFANAKEPWGETLGQTVLNAVVASDAAGAVRTALEVIRNQCAATMQRPLVILYSCLGPQISGQGHRWLLLLPCGALGIVWVKKSKNYLKTCYFTGAVSVKPKRKRWRHALQQQIQEYAYYDEQTGVYRYPAANHRREVAVMGSTCELRYDIHFNAADAWGFTSNTPGSEWSLPRWDWHPGKLTRVSANTAVSDESAD